jgi:hypothetical protein
LIEKRIPLDPEDGAGTATKGLGVTFFFLFCGGYAAFNFKYKYSHFSLQEKKNHSCGTELLLSLPPVMASCIARVGLIGTRNDVKSAESVYLYKP